MRNTYFSVILFLTIVLLQSSWALAGDSFCSVKYELLSKSEKAKFDAEKSGLHYVQARGSSGFTRSGKGPFVYQTKGGKVIRDAETLNRIESLDLPPAYKNIWISEDPLAHVQAVGVDEKGKAQYRYHSAWIKLRSSVKFARMRKFGEALSAMRKRIKDDLNNEGMPKQKVLAALSRILDKNFIRNGNEEYVKLNASYGLTTLRKQHLKISGDEIVLSFEGKSHTVKKAEEKLQVHKIRDPDLAPIFQKLRKMQGDNIFQYEGEDGAVAKISSDDVNQYLEEISGSDFTAKDFRTWGGSTMAAQELLRFGPAANPKEAERNIEAAILFASSKLKNTPSTAKEYYIHPGIFEEYRKGNTLFLKPPKASDGYSSEELLVLGIL